MPRGRQRAARALRRGSRAGAILCALSLAGCGASDEKANDGDAERAARGAGLTIGFLFVGTTDDRGYNQASYEGARAVARAYPDARLLYAEKVPESPAAERVMQRMIDRGATIIFPTSFGHLEPTLKVAARNPKVTFVHEGGLETARNVGTFFGTAWEAVYLSGQAAGLATKRDRLGFVAAFPIAQSLLNVNAFQLGARSVNPRARTRVVFTSDWCDPAKQRAAAATLLGWGADVLTQHQDCTRAVIETAAGRGAKVTGFHFDARELAPDAWLTGASWNWGPLMVDVVRTILAGEFSRSPYAARHHGTLKDGTVRLARFGGAATPRIRRKVRRSLRLIRAGELRPFDGPIRDQKGNVRIAGSEPPVTELEETDYLVKGVVGSLPARR